MATGQTTKKTSGSTGTAAKNKNTGANKTSGRARTSAGGASSKAAPAGTSRRTTSKSTSSSRGASSRNTSSSRGTSSRRSSGRKTSGTRTGGRASSGRKGTQKGYTKEELMRRSGMYDEVKMIVALALSVLMLLSVLNFGGKIGAYFGSFLFGTFGWLGYLTPFILFFGTAFMLSNRRNRMIRKKVIAFICFSVFLMAFLQMMASPFDATTKVVDYYKNCAVYKSGGGIIGGAVCYVLTPLFGKPGCYVIIIIGMALGLVFMAQRAIFTVLLAKLRDWLEEYKEYRAEKRRIKEEMRMELYEETFDDEEDEETYDGEGSTYIDGRAAYGGVNSAYIDDKAAYGDESAAYAEENGVDNETTKTLHNKHFEEKRFDAGMTAGSDADFISGDFKLADVDIEEPKESTLDDHEHTAQSAQMQDSDESTRGIPEITVTRMEPIRFVDTENEEASLTPPLEVPEGVGEKTVQLPNDVERMVQAAENDAQAFDEGISESDSKPVDFTEPVSEMKADGQGHNAMAGNIQKASAKDTQPVTAAEIAPPVKAYVFPPVQLLKKGTNKSAAVSDETLKETAMKLQNTLDSFGVKVQVTNVSCGPSVTRYELTPDQGVKVSKIVALTDDIKLNLAVADIRIEAPIPGKSAVGIEVPNKENTMVLFRDLIESKEFQKSNSNVAFAVGRDISGQVIVTDIAKMPHLLIAGATGSGKSVCINTLIMSIIYKSKPEDVRLIMVDPKVVELSVYNGIPHLLIPVVTDPKKAAGALNWAVMEMTDRYNKFAELGVRDIKGYNEKIENSAYESETYKKMPQIVIIVDELADLMMVASSEVEDAICRLAQLARAAGIHLVIATQRPSVNVITGLIKANIPSRVAFAVSSGVDSRTIIDMNGAEKLMGKGDMLFYPAGMQKPLRVQGAFISDKEVNDVVAFLKEQGQTADYSDEVAGKINSAKSMDSQERAAERDVYFADAGRFIIEKDKASIGMLQRVYKIGFNRAARIMDQLCEAGVVGPEEGTKPRKVLMSAEEFETYIEEYV